MSTEQQSPLVDFFRSKAGDHMGRQGDWNNWSTEQTAVHYLTRGLEFKAYVHERLDGMGIAADPESPHKAAGCRVGGRLDIVQAQLAGMRATAELLVAAERIGAWMSAALDDEKVCDEMKQDATRFLAALAPYQADAAAIQKNEIVQSTLSDAGYAVAAIERELPGCAWTLARITNDRHASTPFGQGYSVTVKAPNGDAAWEKSDTLGAAARRAIDRIKALATQQD